MLNIGMDAFKVGVTGVQFDSTAFKIANTPFNLKKKDVGIETAAVDIKADVEHADERLRARDAA